MDNKASREIPRAGLTAQAQEAESSLGFTYFSAEVKHLHVPSGLNFLQMNHSETPLVNTLDLTRSSVLSRVKNFSSIDLTGTLNNTIKLNWAAVAILSDAFDAAAKGVDSGRMLVVSGNPGDAMQLVNLQNWAVADVQTAETLSATHGHGHQFLAGHSYKAFSLYGATVFVDEVMAVADASVRSGDPLKSQIFSIQELFGSSAPAIELGLSDQDETPPEGAASASFKGVAIVFAGTGGANGDIATTGHYELSKDGGASWMSVGGDLTDATAVYADQSALLRYVGAEEAERLQPQSLMVRLIDDSGQIGSAHYGASSTGSTIDVSVHGLSTAFGADALTLLARSSKPTMSISADQPPVVHEHDDGVPEGQVGSPVSSLVGAGAGLGGKGIAITGVDTTQGTLYYSTNGGSSWTEVIRPLSENNSLFMRSDGDNRVYFKPSPNLMGHSGNALTIRSWDQSEATATIFFSTNDDSLTTPEASLDAVNNLPDNLDDAAQTALGFAAEEQEQHAAVDVTAEDLAAAIATSVNSSMAKVYAMRQGDSLDLATLLSQIQTEGGPSTPGAPGAADNPAPVVHLTMADVLSLPAQNGVHQLVLSGSVQDKLMLSKDEWTDTGAVVNQDGHTYAVYAGSTDASAQLLIDQHMLHNLMSS